MAGRFEAAEAKAARVAAAVELKRGASSAGNSWSRGCPGFVVPAMHAFEMPASRYGWQTETSRLLYIRKTHMKVGCNNVEKGKTSRWSEQGTHCVEKSRVAVLQMV
jgi:hypothetical protein